MYHLEHQAALQPIREKLTPFYEINGQETLCKSVLKISTFLNWVNSPQNFTIFTGSDTPKEWKARRKFAWQSDIVTDWELTGLENQDHASRQQGFEAVVSILKFSFLKRMLNRILFLWLLLSSLHSQRGLPVKGSCILRIVQILSFSTGQNELPLHILGTNLQLCQRMRIF